MQINNGGFQGKHSRASAADRRSTAGQKFQLPAAPPPARADALSGSLLWEEIEDPRESVIT